MKAIRLLGARAVAIALALLIAGSAMTSIVSASDDEGTTASVQANGVTNVCYNASTISPVAASLTWDGANLQWPTSAGSVDYVPVVSLHVKVQASGQVGNRLCKWTIDNDGPFVNGTGTQLLPKAALRNGLYALPMSATQFQVQLNAPGQGVTHPDNTQQSGWGYTLIAWLSDPTTHAPLINHLAPAGTYSTTVTISVYAPAP